MCSATPGLGREILARGRSALGRLLKMAPSIMPAALLGSAHIAPMCPYKSAAADVPGNILWHVAHLPPLVRDMGL